MVFFVDYSQAGQDAIPFAQRRVRGAGNDQHHRLDPLAMPFHRLGKKIPVFIGCLDLQHADWWQAIRIGIAALTLFQMALGLKLFEQPFQVDPVRALDPKGFGDVSFRSEGRVGRNPVEDFFLRGNTRHTSGLSRPFDKVMTKTS